MERNLKNSYQRFVNYQQQSMLEPPLVQTTIENMYLVNFSVGNPPVRQFAAMDTGSNLVWLICHNRKQPSHLCTRIFRVLAMNAVMLKTSFVMTQAGVCMKRLTPVDKIQLVL